MQTSKKMYSQYNIESISDVVTDKTTNLGKKIGMGATKGWKNSWKNILQLIRLNGNKSVT